jgi:pilus assembly protein CpaC
MYVDRAVPLLLVSLLAMNHSARARDREEIELSLSVGEQRVVSSDGVRSYSEGTPGIVDVRLTKDATQFVLVGRRSGSTTLLFILMNGGERHYRISVRDADDAAEKDVDGRKPGTVEARDNIRLDFYFVQLSKAYRHQIGIGFPGAVGGAKLAASFDMTSGSFQEATAMVTDQALPRLDMAQSAGWAKLLRQAAVITANRTEATFTGGGEVNVPIQGALTAEVRKIEFGSNIKVRPNYDRETGRIELGIHADVSDLSDDSGTGVPGRVTSTLDTVVNLEPGQSLVLAGLTARNEARSQTGLPLASRIPIIGVLFGSNSSRSQETENLIFIVPTVVDAVSQQARARIREAMVVYAEYDGDLDEVRLIEPPGLDSATTTGRQDRSDR